MEQATASIAQAVTEAQRMALEAKHRIETHEDVCAERWEASRRETSAVKESVGKVHARLDSFQSWIMGLMGTVVVAAGGIIVTLLTKLG
ncbi:MAG TPA: hypothetical protein VEB20_07565 [Azospirillaceae bacterium]|nr:hypothetical protein [Azospirillaceae bacterium]